MCCFWRFSGQVPATCIWPKWAPQPDMEASVVRIWECFLGFQFWPFNIFSGFNRHCRWDFRWLVTEINLVKSRSTIFQKASRCICTGRMSNLDHGTRSMHEFINPSNFRKLCTVWKYEFWNLRIKPLSFWQRSSVGKIWPDFKLMNATRYMIFWVIARFDFSQFIMKPNLWMVSTVRVWDTERLSGHFPRISQSSRYAWTWMPLCRRWDRITDTILVKILRADAIPDGRAQYW